ncbi:hypothetical protein BD779DRAFT_888835 [Infundibulicybe gibba]|nr:hypothetical protein BD779DRAFT_888835 [Infundibulicybe gibba]
MSQKLRHPMERCGTCSKKCGTHLNFPSDSVAAPVLNAIPDCLLVWYTLYIVTYYQQRRASTLSHFLFCVTIARMLWAALV